jgi:hypothetical protein
VGNWNQLGLRSSKFSIDDWTNLATTEYKWKSSVHGPQALKYDTFGHIVVHTKSET